MSCDYAKLINTFLAATTNEAENKIATDNIDIFLTTLTDVYVSMLEKRTVAVEAESIQFKNKYTKEFFSIGLTALKQSMIIETTELILEFLLLQMNREKDISKDELFEIYLLSKIMPILRPEASCTSDENSGLEGNVTLVWLSLSFSS
jgi:protein-arginine kinase